MKPTMTAAEVAELLHHPNPTSRAAREKVRRLEGRGLPRVPSVSPPVYLRDQVLAFLERQAEASTQATPAPAASGSRRGKRTGLRSGKVAAGKSPITARLDELRAQAKGA